MAADRLPHWVRCVTICNNRCLFCLDADTPRGLVLPTAELQQAIDLGIEDRGASKLVLSGGEPTLHPEFVELVRYGRSKGYTRVQCITNGHRFAERGFLMQSLDAGLSEITFSLHGHTAELHDHLTQNPGSFDRLITGLTRAKRDGRPIVNVDICLNRQNVEHLEQIIELGISLGVTEYDLLQVIPQAAAYTHRDQLFYDVREHLPRLTRVLRLNQHPRIHIWTNRLSATHLEGFEELIQSPEKIVDEVRGRRYPLRAYLDLGVPLECRRSDRCERCFIEPFCTTVDHVVGLLNDDAWQVWWIGTESVSEATVPVPLPFGCDRLGLSVASLADLNAESLPPGAGLYLQVREPKRHQERLPEQRPLTLLLDDPVQLRGWMTAGGLPPGVDLEIDLNRRTAPWLVDHREWIATHLQAVRLVGPPCATLEQAKAAEVVNLARFFQELDLPVRTVGWPACLAPGTVLTEPIRCLPRSLFDPETGRLDPHALARYHILEGYRVKSARCVDCVVTERCEGAHINTVRHQGFAILVPLSPEQAGGWAAEADRLLRSRWPTPPSRVGSGRRPEPVSRSLPGYAPPTSAPRDPLAKLADRQERPNDPGDSG